MARAQAWNVRFSSRGVEARGRGPTLGAEFEGSLSRFVTPDQVRDDGDCEAGFGFRT